MIDLTNPGEAVAIMIPPQPSRLGMLEAAGLVTPATSGEPFSSLKRVTTTESSSEIIAQLRGER